MLMTFLDLAGTFVFALSGGARAVQRQLDFFGVLFLAFVAGVSGGMLRDVLIGVTPPAALVSWHYVGVAVAAGIACYFGYRTITRVAVHVAVLDAIGLGLFAVVGARKALDAGVPPVSSAVLGMLTAIGGGLAADMVTARTPMVLQKEVYAVAALAGSTIVAFADLAQLPPAVAAMIGAAIASSLRLIALYGNWNLPQARQ